MLNIYCTTWCPDCRFTEQFLKDHRIEYHLIDIEREPQEVVKKIIEINGGQDWYVPTFENNNQWYPGNKFRKDLIPSILKELGITL